MDSGEFMSLFGGLPYMNPFMSLNLSGLCATTKLIQCRMYGVNSVEVSRKFNKDPSDVSDLSKADFLARKKVLREVEKWCESMQSKPEVIPENTWRLINYHYEIVKSSAVRLRDFSHMLFTDYTITRFLIVLVLDEDGCKCGNPYHDDYATLAKHHADKMMSLLKYLHSNEGDPKPKWVRATYTTPSKKLPPEFLSSLEPPEKPAITSPPIFHRTPDDFLPSLTEDELDKIDSLRSQSSMLKPISKSIRKAVKMRRDEPATNNMWTIGDAELGRECSYCHKVAANLPQCGRCTLVRYCGPECQKAAWPTHKLVCKKKPKAKSSTSS